MVYKRTSVLDSTVYKSNLPIEEEFGALGHKLIDWMETIQLPQSSYCPQQQLCISAAPQEKFCPYQGFKTCTLVYSVHSVQWYSVHNVQWYSVHSVQCTQCTVVQCTQCTVYSVHSVQWYSVANTDPDE